jgi:hypothetical protein
MIEVIEYRVHTLKRAEYTYEWYERTIFTGDRVLVPFVGWNSPYWSYEVLYGPK